MKKSTVIKLVIGISLVFATWYYFTQKKAKKNKKNQSRIGQVKKMDLAQQVTIAGNVVPARKTIVTAPFNGYVKKLFVKVGQKVKKGAPLVSVVQSLQSKDPVFPLRSPLNGTVVNVQMQEGDFVKRVDSKGYILRIDDLSELYVVSNVPEIDMVKMKVGLEAVVKASAVLNKKYKGEVISISLAAKLQDSWRGNSKVEYPTKIKITDPDDSIKPGMSSTIDIVTKKKTDVLVLPHEFVTKEEDKYYVFLNNGEKKEVEIGLQNEALFEVLSGLSEGQEVKQIDFVDLMTKKNQ